MKVVEQATDRTAHVHMYVEGKLVPVSEYGDYVDLADNAICCYVPLEEDQTIRVGGRFSGTWPFPTKTASLAPKTVHYQKNKKLDTTTFLHKTENGSVDAKIAVALLEDVTLSQGKETETIGTVDLRLYITRQLGVSHTVKSMKKYYAANGHPEHSTKPSVVYNLLAPTFQLESLRVALLCLKPVPPLVANNKLLKDDEDTVTQGSSPAPSDVPLTPIKATRNRSIFEMRELFASALGLCRSTKATSVHHGSVLKPRSKTTPGSGVEPVSSLDLTVDGDFEKATTQDDGECLTLTLTADNDSGYIAQTAEMRGSKPETEQNLRRITGQAGGQTPMVADDTIVVALRDPQADASTCKSSSTKKTTNATTIASSINSGSATNQIPAPSAVKSAFQPLITSTKNYTIRPTHIHMEDAVNQKQQHISTTSTIPTKRPASIAADLPLEVKRTKLRPAPVLPERKKLEMLRKKRAEMAEKQSRVDKQMEPYKKRMVEELERLDVDMMEEELAIKGEHLHLAASVEMLKDFRKADGGN
ncbi:hypothetical protein T440DRAFT_551738 [Plenodomus tracheiphilus IPT5]|uniref:Uncharacterized protein n=1 Tax=Plenodomus tracheiphilus IPT5 TaxID=1408161 RepID=A0A6A7BGS5_9PLEO|nr:hypothetical protein T440DRAFT_551738 [Plenodomus tracheiphilus IPT5]